MDDSSADRPPSEVDEAQGKKAKMWGPAQALGFGLLIYLGAQILAGIVIAVLASIDGQDITEYYDGNLILVSFISSAILGLGTVSLVYLATKKYGGWKALKLGRFDLGDLGWAFPGYMLYFLISLVLFALISVLVTSVDLEQDQVLGFEDAASGMQIAVSFIALVIVAPIAEEILFRGYTYQGLRKRMHWLTAAVISSALFALAHMQLNVGMDTFALGVVACLLLEKTGSLWPSILLHAIKNSIAFYILFFTG